MFVDVRQFFTRTPRNVAVATPGWAAAELARGLQIGFGTAAGALAGALLLAWGLWSYYRQSRFLFALFVLPGALVVLAAVILGRPIFPRFLFFMAGFAALVVVRGALEIGARIERLWRKDGASREVSVAGLVVAALIAAASAAALPEDYRYPKQDFGGAAAYVLSHRGEGEPIVTAGAAIFPYRDYYRQPWSAVASPADVEAIRGQGKAVWVLYTLADYLAAGAPQLMKVLRDECRVAKVFRATVAGGDVTVCVLPPTRERAPAVPPQ